LAFLPSFAERIVSDLTHLDDLAGQDLTETQLQGLLAQIDLDIANLLRDGKLAALKYTGGGAGMPSADRAANLQALLAARQHYETLLHALPSWEVSQGVEG
jgi:hypothetical protein